MELLLFWIIMGVVVGIIANSKGKSFFPWFLYGVLIWPVALTHIIVTKSENQEAAAAPAVRETQGDPVDKLAKLAELKEKGVITEEEFQGAEKETIGAINDD